MLWASCFFKIKMYNKSNLFANVVIVYQERTHFTTFAACLKPLLVEQVFTIINTITATTITSIIDTITISIIINTKTATTITSPISSPLC